MHSEARRSSFARVLFALVVQLVFEGAAAAAGDAPPAIVRHRVKEQDLTTVALTAKAEARLGIETVEAEQRAVTTIRTLGGTLVVPPGRAITIAAPQGGTVSVPPGGRLLAPGASVERGDPLLTLRILPTEDLRRAREIVAVAEARVAVAAERVTTHQGVDDARAKDLLDLAEARAALDAARTRLGLLTGNPTATTDLSTALAPLTVSAPEDGIVRNYLVGVGQTVPGAAPLIEFAALDPLWVRVPVYAGEVDLVRPELSAHIRPLGDAHASSVRVVIASAPPSADPLTATADIFYVLPNPDNRFRPGERVTALVPLGGVHERVVVPWSAVVHDVHGGTWVYVTTAPHVFTRRRVEIVRTTDEEAIVSRGLEAGERIVRTGVAELYGTEFGTGK